MIVKNPTTANSFIDKLIPKVSAEGYTFVEAIAVEATTAKMIGALHPSASGWVFDGFQTHAATGTTKPAVCMDAAASGQWVRCAIEGFVEGVNISGTGTVTTGYSTFTRGHAVYLTGTGHLINSGATWVAIYSAWGTATTAGGASELATAFSVVGVAQSSGATATVDLWMLGKWTVACAAT
jgi:hypothetical protein